MKTQSYQGRGTQRQGGRTAGPHPRSDAPRSIRMRAGRVLRDARCVLRAPPDLRPRRPSGEVRPAPALRGRGLGAPRPAVATMAEDRRGLRSGQPQAGVLPLAGVPDRPVAGQQHPQPPGRAGREGGGRAGRSRLGGARGDGARRRPGQRRAGPARRLLPRLDGHAPAPRDRLRPAVRVRDLPPGDRRRPPGRAPGPLAPPSRPLGGRPPEGGRGGRVELRLPVEGRAARGRPGHADDPRGPAVRPAGRRLRRPDDQHAAALGRGDAPGLQLPRVQPRRLLRRRPGEGRRRVAHAGPLSRRLDAPRQGPAVRPGVLPGRLLAGRYRGAVPPPGQRLARTARQGRDPAQRHPPVAGRRRADAHPAGSGQAGLGRGVGPDRPDARLHQSHPVARGAGDLADRPLRDRHCPGTSRSSTR